jgi:hypothetical protein
MHCQVPGCFFSVSPLNPTNRGAALDVDLRCEKVMQCSANYGGFMHTREDIIRSIVICKRISPRFEKCTYNGKIPPIIGTLLHVVLVKDREAKQASKPGSGRLHVGMRRFIVADGGVGGTARYAVPHGARPAPAELRVLPRRHRHRISRAARPSPRRLLRTRARGCR